ncbi:hypothetical protein H4Q26_008631 [Puccinia striiformis f. sp. tritici PST-130]|nr:hypothetical protein H4Q26_008631 [Puccinia striiformis f. sp. tritici PST-130]
MTTQALVGSLLQALEYLSIKCKHQVLSSSEDGDEDEDEEGKERYQSQEQSTCARLVTPPTSTDDHHFKRCKGFRCSLLTSGIADMWKGLGEVFYHCIDVTRHWPTLANRPKGRIYRALESYHGTLVIEGVVNCNKVVNKIIKWSQLVKWTTILTRLARIYFHGIANTKTRKLTFGLDTAINSTALSTLKSLPVAMCGGLRDLVNTLAEVRMNTDLLNEHIFVMRNGIIILSRYFNVFSLFLVEYLVPWPPGDDEVTLEPEGKAWLSTWQDAWKIASDRLLNALDNGPDEHQDNPVNEE